MSLGLLDSAIRDESRVLIHLEGRRTRVPPHVPCYVDVDRTLCQVADRIDHCVPAFQETVELVSGLPVPVRSEDALDPASEESEEVEEATRHFCGNSSPVVSVASDRAPEIVGFISEPAIPGDALHNPFAESAIRTLKQGTATLLLQSDLSKEHWEVRTKMFAFMCNVAMPPPKEI